jgi:hypothetical protein
MEKSRTAGQIPWATTTKRTKMALINIKIITQVSYSFVLFYTQLFFGRVSFKGATTLGLITISITTFILMTLSMRGLYVTLSISNSLHK